MGTRFALIGVAANRNNRVSSEKLSDLIFNTNSIYYLSFYSKITKFRDKTYNLVEHNKLQI